MTSQQKRKRKPKLRANNVAFVEVNPPVLLDDFYGQKIFEVTRVLWKGDHMLSVKKVVKETNKSSSVLDDEDDEDDDSLNDSEKDLAKDKEEKKFLLQSAWPQLAFHHGDFATKAEAEKAARKVVEKVEDFLREKFCRRRIQKETT